MDDIEIITLGPGDIGLMRGLNAMFGEAFEDPEHYAAAPPDEAYLAKVLARPQVVALAAIADGRVVGGITAYELEKLEQAHSELYLYDLAVAESHRRRGVATALIRRLQQIARERGAWVVFVQADYGDDPAVALYSKLGVKEEVMHFDLPVAGDG